jgi:alpha-galactosidase
VSIVYGRKLAQLDDPAIGGVDAEVSSAEASVVLSVIADGVTLFTSPVLGTGSTPVTIDLNVTGRTTLHLVTGDAGNGLNYDHADWADARLLC